MRDSIPSPKVASIVIDGETYIYFVIILAFGTHRLNLTIIIRAIMSKHHMMS